MPWIWGQANPSKDSTAPNLKSRRLGLVLYPLALVEEYRLSQSLRYAFGKSPKFQEGCPFISPKRVSNFFRLVEKMYRI